MTPREIAKAHQHLANANAAEAAFQHAFSLVNKSEPSPALRKLFFELGKELEEHRADAQEKASAVLLSPKED